MTHNPERLDAHLLLLADRRRRQALRVLADHDEAPMAVEALIDAVFVEEAENHAAGASQRKRLVTAMRHNHLPRLAAHGIVDYDPDAGEVEYLGDEAVESLLAFLSESL